MEKSPPQSSRSKVLFLVLSAFVLSVSLTLLAVAARPLAYSLQYGVTTLLFLDYNPLADADCTNELSYWTFSLRLDDTFAYIAAGALGVLLGSPVVAMTIWDSVRVRNFSFSGRNARLITLTGPLVIFALDVCMVIVSFTTSYLAWVRWQNADWHLRKTVTPMHPVNYTVVYYYPVPQTLESWNCVLARNAVPSAHNPTGAQLASLCAQGKAARYLILVLLVAALLRVALKPARRFLAWRRSNIVARHARLRAAEEEGLKINELESRDNESHEGTTTAPTKHQSSTVLELPADRTSKFEMDDDAAFREMPGEYSTKELEGDFAAVEIDAVDCARQK